MKKLLIAAILGTTGLMSAQAAVVTQSDSYGYDFTNWNHGLGALNLFDTALGSLNKVVVTLTGGVKQRIRAENESGAQMLTPVAGGTISFLKGTSVTLAQVLPTTTGLGFAADDFDGAIDYNGTSGVDFGILEASQTDIFTFTSPAALANFIGVGTMAGFWLDAIAGGSINSANGNLTQSIRTEAFGRIDIAYDYTAAITPPANDVPEPGSLALMAAGLLGMAAVRRKKA